jgi:hypothetical protein
MPLFFRLNEGNVARHSIERLNSFVDAVVGKRITYRELTDARVTSRWISSCGKEQPRYLEREIMAAREST